MSRQRSDATGGERRSACLQFPTGRPLRLAVWDRPKLGVMPLR